MECILLEGDFLGKGEAMYMAAQGNSCQIVNFQEYLEKKELEAQMKKIINREIMVIIPTHFSQADTVSRKLLTGETVILNLSYMEINERQRFMDFVCGTCYTLGGALTCVSTDIYIISVDDSIDTVMAETKTEGK